MWVRPPPRLATFFHGDYETFSMVVLSLPLIQEGQLSVSVKGMCTILVNHLRELKSTLSVPEHVRTELQKRHTAAVPFTRVNIKH